MSSRFEKQMVYWKSNRKYKIKNKKNNMKNIDRYKLYTGILGLAIGDALGVPAEFMSREQLKENPIQDMIGGGVWNQPAGTWSDDTAMTLATVDAINKVESYDDNTLYQETMNNFVDWYKHGEFAVDKNRFDIGNTCKAAINNYIINNNIASCGIDGEAYGNGALMRIFPAVFLDNIYNTARISMLTHRNTLCTMSSILYTIMCCKILNGSSKEDSFRFLNKYIEINKETTPHELLRLADYDFINTNENDIKSSGYVVDTLEASIWCFMNTNSYRECVLKAINLGEDTDTVGAIAGALAGLYYGIGDDYGIPYEWINKLRDHNILYNICYNKNIA